MKAYEWLVLEYNKLQRARFFGKLIIELRDGKVVLVRLEETKIPPKDLE